MVETRMDVTIAGVHFRNPVIAASGTFGFGREYLPYLDVSAIGGITFKALTPEPRQGNPPARIAETPCGILNSVGLQNPGVDAFLTDIYPGIYELDTVKIVNVAGRCESDYLTVIEKLNDTNIDLFELNVSCPNVAVGGMSLGRDPKTLRQLVEAAKKVSKKPLIIKLTPNVADIRDQARAASDGGADALSLINTITGMAVDVHTKRPILHNVTGGLSGPAIKPVALRMVHEVYTANLGLPIIGMGGVFSGIDAAEFMICGASAVMVGTRTLREPRAVLLTAQELERFADAEGIEDICQLTGSLIVED